MRKKRVLKFFGFLVFGFFWCQQYPCNRLLLLAAPQPEQPVQRDGLKTEKKPKSRDTNGAHHRVANAYQYPHQHHVRHRPMTHMRHGVGGAA